MLSAVLKLIPFVVLALSMAMLLLMYARFSVLTATLSSVPVEFISLNVGGTVFATTTATVLSAPESIFPVVLSAPHWPRDEAGAYLFDWGSQDVPYVLEYLRTGRLEATAPYGTGTIATSHHLRRTFAFFRLSLPPVSLALQRTMDDGVELVRAFLRTRVCWDVARSDAGIEFSAGDQVASWTLEENMTSPLTPPVLVGADIVTSYAVWTTDKRGVGVGVAPRHCYWSLIEDCVWYFDGAVNATAGPGIVQLVWEGDTRIVTVLMGDCNDPTKCLVDLVPVATVQTYLGRNADLYPTIRLGGETQSVTFINPLPSTP
ncbi:hypothetical protein ACHHYP_10974 [Achlya hypogyna]|uniref:Potassium channel tetramerisation-type BTB domain-containing protein n=1 Tax=Achlya hypogyna TaxID=1202772 RepID=A0A1V9YK51_ACHHY|nr:hypothetical protein ACHHYP_10974 [Achlya hypogyna]